MSRPDEQERPEQQGVTDEMLPEDLRPGPDNPLAEPLEEGVEVEGVAPPDLDDPAHPDHPEHHDHRDHRDHPEHPAPHPESDDRGA